MLRLEGGDGKRGTARRRWFLGSLAAAGLIAAAVAQPGVRWALIALWVVGNGVLSAAAGVWGLLHPRGILRASDTALRWAFWLAVVSCLWLAAGLESLLGLAARAGLLPVPAASILVMLVL